MRVYRFIGFMLMAVMFLSAYADNYTLTKKEQQQITEEAENWIDDMPDGIQDRLSDAVNHALHGFYNEINYFRNYNDTTGLNKYKVKVENINGGKLGEMSMRLYSGTKNSNVPLLIYFHGGGWSVGSLVTSDKFCRALASEGNIKVVSVDYPLAPENPYPGALKNCIDAVEYILTKSKEWGFSSDKISLGGDGAGGNLALETFSKLPDTVKIKSLVVYYPLLQTKGLLDPKSKREFGRGYGFDSRLWEAFTTAYNRKGDDLSQLQNLPPTLVISAGRDIIIDEERNFALNSKVNYVQFDGALHGFISDNHQKSAFNKAVSLTDRFLSE